MQAYFHALADRLTTQLDDGEVLLLAFDGEESDFVRMNRNRVRQAGSVTRRTLTLDLIEGQRHAGASVELAGNGEPDLDRLEDMVRGLRAQRAHLPGDPYLLYATEPVSSAHPHENTLPDSAAALERILQSAQGMDLVGIWASGTVYTGFANSLGQRNWHSSASFNLDWSGYYAGDKAVKSAYAGFQWDPAGLETKMEHARAQLAVMSKPARTLAPGRYRAYLAPAALQEILDLVAWGGFSLKSHRTRQTPLLKMITEGRNLHPSVNLTEDHARGLAPRFTADGFLKPPQVPLIAGGAYRDCLAEPRSAREYGVEVNAGLEAPESLDMAAGTLPRDEVLRALGTGLYIGNLWYCNFSDPNDARITGMTRFACFWVEDGAIRAPVNVMRFDDSLYHLLGDRLEALTAERELILDSSTYERRSVRSDLLPGALVDAMTFTL